MVSLIFYHFPQIMMKMKILLILRNNISHLTILFQAKNYVKKNFIKLSEDNLLNFAEEFLKALTFSDNDRMTINKATIGQHKNKSR